MTKTAPPVKTGDPLTLSEQAFMHALQLQQNQALNADFARRCLKTATLTTAGFLCTLPLIAWLGWQVAHPPVKYFATVNGHIVRIHPTNRPAYSDADIIDWGQKTLRKAFTLDYKNYRTQLNAVQADFSEDGFRGYYTALTKQSNLFSTMVKERLLMTPAFDHPGVIVKRGQPAGSNAYMWEVQYPVTLAVDGQNNRLRPQKFTFIVRIQQTNVLLKPGGREITSINTRPEK